MSSWQEFLTEDPARNDSGSAGSGSPNPPPYVRPASFPDGLIGDIAEYARNNAYYPNDTIALVASLAFMAGICGRAFNVEGAGLNLYILLVAATGSGKEAISDGTSRLISAVAQKVPAVRLFRGPGELVSPSGLVNWLASLPFPVAFSVIGEFGFMLQAMTGKSASPQMKLAKGLLLKLFHKSGHGSEFGDTAYSDREKNPGVMLSPAYTLVGEGTPTSVYSSLDETNIADGFVSRFLTFEANEPRPYLNQNRITQPPSKLVNDVADLVSKCMSTMQGEKVIEVAIAADASEEFVRLERLATDMINDATGEAVKQLWNRALLKTRKLSALVAIGRNFESPQITLQDCQWASGQVGRQTETLIGRFNSGDVGEVGGDETKQTNAVIRCIYEYVSQPFERFEKYGVSRSMHQKAVFTQSYLSRRVLKLPTFADDRIGATNALHRAIKNMMVADEIRQLPTDQTISEFGTQAKAFAISKPNRFLDDQK